MPTAQLQPSEDESVLDRMERAFARLQTAWQAVHPRILSKGNEQISIESIRELDAAEEEWLAARETLGLHRPTTQ